MVVDVSERRSEEGRNILDQTIYILPSHHLEHAVLKGPGSMFGERRRPGSRRSLA